MDIALKKFGLEKCIHGYMMFPINDQVIGKLLKEFGEFAEGENIMLDNFISKGDIVLDIGANIGTQTLSISKQVGENGKVIAFEPQNIISQCLQTNLTLNDITNVKVYNMAVTNKNGWVRINDTEFSEKGRYGEAGISKSGTKIKAIKLDEIDLEECNLIKIDVESFEWEVIQGGQDFLKKHKPYLYMEAKKDIKGTKKYLKWLLENGWNCYWHFAWWWRIENFKKNKKYNFKGDGDMNILAVPTNKTQPDFLPKIKNSNEEWNQKSYSSFFKENNIKII